MTSQDRLRAMSRLQYRDPKIVLMDLRKIELSIAGSDISPAVRHLRTNDLKPIRELREASLFCYGWGQINHQSIYVAHAEHQDYDAVGMWLDDEGQHFAPIQLKEVVPEQQNPSASVQRVLDQLQKYVASEDLTVVIHLNRVTKFTPSELVIPKLNVAAIWVLSAIAPDQSNWMIFGNFLEDTLRWGEFAYPT